MADLTAYDLCAIPQEVIDGWNSGRSSLNMPNLLKNPLVGKGEAVSPNPDEDLFAHNFISVADFAFLSNLVFDNPYRPTRRYIPSCPKDRLYLDEVKTLIENYGTYRHLWGGYEGGIGGRYLFENIPSEFSIGPVEYSGSYVFQSAVEDAILGNVEYFPEPHVASVPTQYGGELVAQDFITPFSYIRTDFDNLKNGCMMMCENLPVLTGCDVSVTGKTHDGSRLEPYGYTSDPDVNGRYEKWTRSVDQYGTVIGENHTTYVPSSYEYDAALANGNYHQYGNGQVRTPGGTFSDFFIVTYAFKAIRTGPSGYSSRKLTTRYHSAESLGTMSYDATGATYFIPNSASMKSALDSVSDETTLALSPPQGETFSMELFTQVGFFVMASIKPSAYS